MASAVDAIEKAPSSKTVDESLWWDSFVTLFEELDAAPLSSDLPDQLLKKVKSNHTWLLDSVTRFKSPSEVSKLALDSSQISIGSHRLIVKPELKEAALRVSSCLGLDEVQSYILVSRVCELNGSVADFESQYFLHLVLLQYCHERQCLLKCIRRILVHALCLNNVPCSSNAIVAVATQLVHDGLESKLLSVVIELLSSATSEKSEVDFTVLWVEESLIENNLVLDTMFLLYYDNFCSCNCEQWKRLCSVLKDILCGSFRTGKLAVSLEARTSFDHAKSQILLILIETLDLENLLRMIHDEVPFRQFLSLSSLKDVSGMDVLVSSFSVVGTKEAGLLLLVWAVFVCLLLSLPEGTNCSLLMEIDHNAYLQQAFEAAPFTYVLEILRGDAFKNSDGPISGYLSVLRTVISAFIASYELHQTAENTLNLILDVLFEIYHGEDSLCMQFWDRDSLVDGPIRSLLYMLESEYPYHTVGFVRMLSALCSGMWSAECVYNFLEKMTGATLLHDIPGGPQSDDTYNVIAAPIHVYIPSVEGLVIPKGTHGQILKFLNANVALVRWEFAHSGLFLLLLCLTQNASVCSHAEVSVILQLLDRMVSSSVAVSFRLLCFEKSVPVESVNGIIDMNVRVDLVKIICTIAFNSMPDVNTSHIMSLCIHILAEILKCAPCHVTEELSMSNLFGTSNFDSSSGTWLLSGGLARMLIADCEENGDCSQLATSVLDFTIHLMERGGDDNLASAFIVFSLQYVLVNHMHWKFKMKYARWKVTLKALAVVKSCVKAIQVNHKLGLMIRDILLFDSSIHNIFYQILCISPTELERSNIYRHYEFKEIEGLQLAVSFGLDIVYALLDDFLKFQESFSKTPTFIQTILSPTTKPIPVVEAAVTWISFSQNSAIQVTAARVFSKLCVVSSRVQPDKIGSVGLVVDAIQIKHLNRTILRILDGELGTKEELLTTIFDLLTCAANYQPTILVSLMLTEEDEKVTTTTSGINRKQLSLSPVTVLSGAENSVHLILKYVKKSAILIKSAPCLLLSVLNLLKALWDDGAQYLHILEAIRRSELFWKHLSSILGIEVKSYVSARSLNVSDAQNISYRYLCQGTVLEILARELFLLEKLIHNEILEVKDGTGDSKEQGDNRSSTKTSKFSYASHPNDILSTFFVSSTMENLVRSYSSSGYDKEVIQQAKISASLCILHLIIKLSTGDTGSLSISLVEKISSISKKLSKHPAFSALLAQYASYGYSAGKELHHLVLNDLYYHMEGELEGRQITQGPFQELSVFLLESEAFLCNICKIEDDECPSANVSSMFETTQVRAELGLELWEHSGWTTSVEVAERMLLLMDYANIIMSIVVSKNSSLQSLVAIISMHNGNVSRLTYSGISMSLIESSIRYVCKCLQETEDQLVPALNPSEILLKALASQAELLLVLSLILFGQNSQRTNRKYLSLSLLLIKTSGFGIRFLADVRPSTAMLNKAVKFLLTLLLSSIEYIYPKVYAEDKSDLEVDQFAEVSLTSIGLLPVLCKYVEHTEFCDLSVASVDLMLKGFLAANTWLPILDNHLQLQLIVQRIQQKDALFSVHVTLNFILTLARTKRGAQMLYAGRVFSSLKVLFSYLINHSAFSHGLDGGDVSTIFIDDAKPARLWGLCLAIITSMIHSLGDDPSCTDILDSTIRYFFYEKGYIVSSYLSMPNFISDQSKNRTRVQKTRTSLTTLILTEHSLTLVCVLASHQTSWSKGMKEIDSELREKCIHLLAFISKGLQRTGDSPNKLAPLFCLPTGKEEIELDRRPSFVNSKHGWFRVCALGLSAKSNTSAVSSREVAQVIKDHADGNDLVHQSRFSDTLAIQMYRIAFLLLKFLCMQAKAAAERAEELALIDLAYFPELPMPEILHGLQDQTIAIVTEVCEAHKLKSMQHETEGVCILLLQILEKTLYLELCVSQSCGHRPVLGRIEDFSKEIKALMQAVEQHPKFKASLRSLLQITSLVYPGLLQGGILV